MPTLDINELLDDPDLAGMCFEVIRSSRITNTGGRTVETPKTFSATGALYPSSDQELSILSDEDRVGSFITVVTGFRLVPLTTGLAPDMVVWENANYRVMHTTDYRQYGRGMVVAICQLINFVLDDSIAEGPRR